MTKSNGQQTALSATTPPKVQNEKTGTTLSTDGSDKTSPGKISLVGANQNATTPANETDRIRALLNEPSTLQDGLTELKKAMSPMTNKKQAEALIKMRCLTKRRDGEDDELLIAAYMEKLRRYPSDTVSYVLDVWPDGNIFFPAWAELRESLDFWHRPRRELYARLQSEGKL